jgi:hypothetical protein
MTMAIGPGKYDDLCTLVRERVGIGDDTGGGVFVIVVGGNRGDGFSCQCDLQTMTTLPDVLQHIVDQMRDDMRNVAG